jgi:hypothetical protein
MAHCQSKAAAVANGTSSTHLSHIRETQSSQPTIPTIALNSAARNVALPKKLKTTSAKMP